jgi:hypothetical protein
MCIWILVFKLFDFLLGRGFYKALGKGKYLTISIGIVTNPLMYVRWAKVCRIY